jgi:hypothetical protein
MLNPSVYAWSVMFKSTTNALYAHRSLPAVTHVRPQTSATLAMLLFSEMPLRQLKVSASAKMDTLKMIKKFVYCAQCQDVPTARHKMFAAFAILRFIESRHQLMASVYARQLILKIQSSNVYCVRLQAA